MSDSPNLQNELAELDREVLGEESFYTPHSLRRKNHWLVTLRWYATAGLTGLLVIGYLFLPDRIPLGGGIVLVVILLAINLVFFGYDHTHPPNKLTREANFVRVQIIADLLTLTGVIHLSGGIQSPFIIFYVFLIIIASTIFELRRDPFIVASIAVVLFSSVVFGEYTGWFRHFNLFALETTPLQTFFTLGVFLITIFFSTYLGVTLMGRHQKVKNLIIEKNRQLENASQERLKFFRFVSHELKSPIIAIQSSVNVVLDLMNEHLPAKAIDMLNRAKNRSEQMMDIVKDLLIISYEQQELGNEPPEWVSPCDFLQEFIENERPRSEEKNIDLNVDICQECCPIKVDKFKLEKIVSNLLGNAIRYTPKGGQIDISTMSSATYWSFTIKDNGIGIAEQDMDHIFAEFYRSPQAKKFEFHGTGLGMSIVKRMVDDMQGEIFIESNLDRGTEVTVRLPINTS